MGMLRGIEPADGMVCMCIPPLYWTVGVGSVWQCDRCARVYLRQAGTPAWKRVTLEEVGL